MSFAKRARGPLIIIGASALGGAVYRSFSTSPSSSASLNPHDFTSYTLISRQPVSSTSAIFTLRNERSTTESDSVKEVWKRSIWSVQIKQPQLQIARAYTPLPPDPSPKDGRSQDLRLLIRQEEGGEVSTYLHRLPESATIEIRGPNTEIELPRNIIEVVFLAGGTGIAPAMQVAQALARRTSSRMHILWANRRREECEGGVSDEQPIAKNEPRTGWWKSLFGSTEPTPQAALVEDQGTADKGLIVQELEKLKRRSEIGTRGLKVQYYVDEEKTFIQPDDITRRVQKGINESGSKLIIVSGPDGFIDHWAGKKVWAGGREVQGPLGGQLSKMDLGDWKVVKL